MSHTEQQELLEHLNSSQSFAERLKACSSYPLHAQAVETLQMNITRRCNLCCRHCHVAASPDRSEEMSREDMEACIRAAAHPEIKTLDITGGAPEMHSRLAWFINEAAGMQKRLLVRSNAAILLEKQYAHFLDIYADAGVEVVVSLPNLHRDRTDRMRGPEVFGKIVKALGKLNARGYGMPGTGLVLDLVHNPVGAFLPGSQTALEEDYRTRLGADYGIAFNRLYCLTNCPVGRYLDFLKRSGNLGQYIGMLKEAFNSDAVGSVMCRTTLSVGFDGRLFDCDFNQILDLTLSSEAPVHIRDFDYDKIARREIVVRGHCYSCTAGAGSSCQGSLET